MKESRTILGYLNAKFILKQLAGNRPYVLAFTLLSSIFISWISIQIAEIKARQEHREILRYEIKNYALQLMSQTVKSNVMGGITLLGIVADPIKPVAIGKTGKDMIGLMETLSATARGVKSDNTFIVAGNGIVVADNPKGVKSAVGLNVGFRPYFTQAMRGLPNVYAAVSMSTGERGFYITAPIRENKNAESMPIGAISVRLTAEPVDKLLESWKGHALLLSPQGVVFSANNRQWLFKVRPGMSQDEFASIKREKQFGAYFDKTSADPLPFAINTDTTVIYGRRYAVEQHALAWNDPLGDWTLVLMEDHSNLLSIGERWKLALTIGICSFLCIIFVIAYMQSRNKRKHNEQALRDNERKMRRILETANEGFWLIDNNTMTLDLNESMRKILDRPREEILGRSIFDFVDEENILIFKGNIARRTNGEVGSYEVALSRPDGSKVPCLFNASPLHDENGIKTGSFAMCADITKIKSIEESMKKSVKLSRLILNSAGEGIFGVDSENRVIFFNDSAAAMLGYTSDEVIGNEIHNLIQHSYPDGSPYPLENCPMFHACARGEKKQVSGEVFWRKDGSMFLSEYSVTPIADDNGGRVGAVVVFRDITERKKNEDELNKRMEDLERFNRLTMGREERMIQLKMEINALLEELGKEKKYRSYDEEK